MVREVVGAAYEVSNTLKCGFLEKVYERALVRELGLRGLGVRQQVSYSPEYKGVCVGYYLADLVVEEQLIFELKCVDCFSSEHMAQAINYLRASNLKIALLINFQKPKVEWKRVIF
jgi:GxxExxY protein